MLSFSGLVDPNLVIFKPGCHSQKSVFELLADNLALKTDFDADEIEAALSARESIGTTGFGFGTAIPHGRLEGLQGIHACVVRLAHPVEWNAVDGLPVDIVVGLIAPAEASALHLKALALISRALRDTKLLEKLRGASDADAIWAILAGRERQVA